MSDDLKVCREAFDSKHLPHMSSPDCWDDGMKKIYESAFQLFHQGWEAALNTRPSAGPDEGLADELQKLYDAVKCFPEQKPDGLLNLLDLRNMVPAAIAALRSRPQPSAWRGMKQASRDGTQLNVIRDTGCGWECGTVWWVGDDPDYPWHSRDNEYSEDFWDFFQLFPSPPENEAMK